MQTVRPPAPPPASAVPRRAALAAALALVPLPARAAIGRWDGTSSALGSCPVGPAGDGCRAGLLAADVSKGIKLSGASSGASAPLSAASTTAATLDGPYAAATRSLAADIKAYLALAPDDSTRIPAGRKLRADGAAWVSKYARGGSARAPSARTFYIAVDAIMGHLAANGAAPFPAAKAPKLAASVDGAVALLDKER